MLEDPLRHDQVRRVVSNRRFVSDANLQFLLIVGQQHHDFAAENLVHLATGHRDEELGPRGSRKLAAQSVKRGKPLGN
jgi:hypothetical protein